MEQKTFKGRDSSLAVKLPLLAASLSLNVVALVIPISILLIFDRVIPFQSVETLRMLTVLLLVSAGVELVLRWSRLTLLNAAAEKAAVSNYRRFASRILHANTQAFSRDSASAYIDRFSAIAQLRDHHAGQNHALLIDLPFMLVFAVMVALIGGWLVLVPITGLVAVLVFSLLMKRAQWALFDRRKSLDSRRYAFLSEVLSSNETVKANRMERQMKRRFELLEDQTVDLSHRLIRFSGFAQNFGAVFGQVSVAAMGLFGAFLVIRQQIGIAEMAACMLLNGRIVQPLTKLMTLWVQSESVALSWRKLREIDALDIDPVSTKCAALIEGNITLRNLRLQGGSGDSERSGVSSMVLAPGQIGLVSSNAIWQIQALYDAVTGHCSPAAGEVLIDGVSAQSLVSRRGQDAIVVLENDPAILSGTILENLSAFGDETHISRAKEFAAKLGLEKRIHRLPMGYNTKLGSGSAFENDPVNRQLIALVRVLALRPRILLLNEPTAVLDTAEREDLAECLASLSPKPTILMNSPDPRMKGLADVECKLTCLVGDEVADWDADAHAEQTAAEQRKDVA
ncbi:ABC transporter transmembrane domain-containing protein [Pseudophaeobacter arcticus]|jgi:ATP-binding cassette subfamily C protein LapB|uniref:ABC transporter transmembrane domain-containing protein n=1 Tax=Pseudophaeobacter arcticus TaxID=385492 RepID=UPI0003F861F6|nr:ABC transporter transmembrane domain-containing protein [Pseudophaeobacter arcticus]